MKEKETMNITRTINFGFEQKVTISVDFDLPEGTIDEGEEIFYEVLRTIDAHLVTVKKIISKFENEIDHATDQALAEADYIDSQSKFASIIEIERLPTNENPVWRCRTSDGDPVNIYWHADAKTDNFALFSAAGYDDVLKQMPIGTLETWSSHPIQIGMKHDGIQWIIEAVSFRSPHEKPDSDNKTHASANEIRADLEAAAEHELWSRSAADDLEPDDAEEYSGIDLTIMSAKEFAALAARAQNNRSAGSDDEQGSPALV